jgi:signal transduction histidine kinase
MLPRKKAQAAFSTAVVLLLLSAIAAYVAIDRLMESERWVMHTLEVRAALGDIDSAFVRAGRARSGYLISGSEDFVTEFEIAVPDVSRKLQHLRGLVGDNSDQVNSCEHLENITKQRLALLEQSVQLRKNSPEDKQGQADIDRRGLAFASDMTTTMQEMRAEEQGLLKIRQTAMHHLFVVTVLVLSSAFIVALVLFFLQYRLLSVELKAREQAEYTARNSEESLRRLTGRLLQIQDAERRKFSRELHDSLGQYLVGVKMNLEMYAAQKKDNLLTEAVQLLDQSIAETRTISHLLHPPLLDEAGLSSAAKWYLEGFAQRSGIAVDLDLPDDLNSLPKPIALGLFRILQESLTNIHRHSESTKAEIRVKLSANQVSLEVRDFGKGMSPIMLRTFQTQGANSGVGLAGMRERMRELGGQLTIKPCTPGTLISVTIPLSQTVNAPAAD